ncbi:hypothetical protein NM208_g6460 [Fusarium decemcellulare]|uniref:Uncharacterized protein n=1 Tax=Fusarium decemcellulare TaxID=57161 RepID=A0ACC1SDD6_9HYPO|nr:hypothetical protein NM208_g6460 [Fusarium decemcellulare]
MARRLVAQHQGPESWILSQVRRLERAGLLFLASIAPGVAERHIANLEAAARAERERREAEAAAAAAAEENNQDNEGQGENRGDGEVTETGTGQAQVEGGEDGRQERGVQENNEQHEPAREQLIPTWLRALFLHRSFNFVILRRSLSSLNPCAITRLDFLSSVLYYNPLSRYIAEDFSSNTADSSSELPKNTGRAAIMSGGWNTIESDAGVFTSLIENLGVKDVQFEELLTLDPSELLTLQPVYGVIFLFKYPTDQPYATPEGPRDGSFDHGASENIFFAAQTIQNACATQALLSVVLNKTGDVEIGEKLGEFREFTMVLPPEFRGEALSNSDLIREVHNSFARSSPFADETDKTGAEAEDAFHFIAYTPINGTLYELDGLQPAPISHGACTSDDFASRVVEVLQRRIARYDTTEIRFNLLAMCRDLRQRARDFGDEELLAREERKRRDWMFENALRRHNFVGFAGEVLKGVVRGKIAEGGDAACEKWVKESLERRKAAEQALRGRGGGGGGDGDGDVDMGA